MVSKLKLFSYSLFLIFFLALALSVSAVGELPVIEKLNVYQSNSTTIGSGTAVCTNVTITTATSGASCGPLERGVKHRIEITVSNTVGDFTPTAMDWWTVFASGKAIGANATISGCGCDDSGTNRTGTTATSGADVSCFYGGESVCTVPDTGTAVTFYFLVTIGSDANNSGGTFYIDSGAKDYTSSAISFTVSDTIVCGITCDQVCPSLTCFGSDPDCDSSGNATVCCGNNTCESGETCGSCGADCGACPSGSAPIAVCGDYVCQSPENKCNCPIDCGSCGGNVFGTACDEFQCLGGACQEISKTNCCGNDSCETDEGYGVCRLDCPTPKELLFTPLFEKSYLRGDNVNFTLRVNADSVSALGAIVTAKGFFGTLEMFDDGTHGDIQNRDGVYTNTFKIPIDTEEGLISITIDANFLQTQQTNTIDLNVSPRLNLISELNKNLFSLGDIIDFSGSVKKRENPIKANVELKILSGDETVFEKRIETNQDGLFSDSYHSTTIDPIGEWLVIVKAVDDLNNYQIIEHRVEVLEQLGSSFLRVELTPKIIGSFRKGSELRIIAEVTDSNSLNVGAAIVELLSPSGEVIRLQEIGDGVYSGTYRIPFDLGLDKQRFVLNARREIEGLTQSGSTFFNVQIESTDFLVELIEPKKTSFQVGDEVEFRVKLTYHNGEAVKESTVQAFINNELIEMQAIGDGIYSTTYFISNLETTSLKFFLNASDAFQNTSGKKIEVEVSGTSINYFIRTYPIIFYLIVIGIIATVAILALNLSQIYTLSSLKKKQALLLAEKKDIQTRYFKKSTMNREKFNELKSKIDPELQAVREEIKKVSKKRSESKLKWLK